MLKPQKKWYSLPSLQKRILLNLAREGPQTRNQVQKNVKSAYKNVLYSFKSLTKKGLIKIVDQKVRRGRKFPKYWLTATGIFSAFINDANVESLLKNAEKIYPDNQDFQVLAQLGKVLDKKAIEKILSLIALQKEEMPMALTFLATNPKAFTRKNPRTLAKEIGKVVKRHPEYYKLYKRMLKNSRKELDEFIASI